MKKNIIQKGSGIYKIQSVLYPERIYIGSACDVRQRRNKHFSDLRKGMHGNGKLQNHFNKYGGDDLVFSVLSYCDIRCLTPFKGVILIEQIFMILYAHESHDMIKPYFNINPRAGSSLGVKRRPRTAEEKERARVSATGKKQTQETIESRVISLKLGAIERGKKLSKALKGRAKTQETIDKIRAACIGRVQSIEAMAKSSKTKTGKKLSESQIEQIKKSKSNRTEEEIKIVNEKISESVKKSWIIRKEKNKKGNETKE